ncbi:MAG: type IV toxin-antitoxin system AbiEi family antitoxin [Chloroflexota bacterium]|nr:type IV toxin-antitoxin system AbiEi family antitoxin [Chloroflexota bacterium]
MMAAQEEVKAQVVDQLRSLLPQTELLDLDTEGRFKDARFDLVAQVRVAGVERTLLVEVKSSGQPRYLRQVIARFQEAGISDANVHFLIAAPYISPRGMDVCREHDVGCVDLVGNVYLAFDSVYIERVVEEKPQRRKRWIKNLFAPVSSRIVRAMLEEPDQAWRLTELAEATDASLGQTYKVSEKLVDEDFARKSTRDGLTLTDPAGLLDLWRQVYDVKEANEIHSFHASERDPERFMTQVQQAGERLGHRYAFTLHAGASLVAPYVRFNDLHFYVGTQMAAWVDELDLHTVEFGGNVHLLQPYDEGVFYRLRTPQGMAVVGNIQLYLDLYKYPARGREQAEFLREKEIGF